MKPSLAIKKEKEDLEKPANKLNNHRVQKKYINTFILFIFLSVVSQLTAQDRLPFDQGKKFILAKVNVLGKTSYNPQTIVTFAGLEKGQSIHVPGEGVSNAIKKLAKLGLFSDIDFYINEIKGDSIYLDLQIVELPKLNEAKITGVKKNKIEDLVKENGLTKGKIVNANFLTTTKNYLENKYKKDGYYNTKVNIRTIAEDSTKNAVNMLVNIDKGEKIKIKQLDIEGNEMFSDEKVREAMKNTKKRYFFRLFKASKFIQKKYEEDLNNIVDKYKEKGYRDARIVSDSVWLDKKDNLIGIKIKVEEGKKYVFGDIKFLGNTVYSDQLLSSFLGIKKGDTYNGVLLEKRISDKSQPDGEDITNLYQNNGYLFSTINPVEVRTVDNSIDFEIRITEGQIAYFNKISVVGNDKTNDKVIYRELRTKPGEKYNKELLIRTIREIGQLGFFDPQTIQPNFKNVDPVAGTVDIEYSLKEKGSSQVELQGGYGNGGFIGTLGLSFNNFSIGNIFKKDAYHPLPMGDGQKVALRLQAATYFRTYSFSFSEPWFGGKKPVSFSTSLSYSRQFLYGGTYNSVDKDKYFNILSLSTGIAKRLTVPDDYFVLSTAVSLQHYDLHNYNTGLFTFGNGASKNLAFNIGLTRNSKGIDPVYPVRGSEVGISTKFTLPYSAFNGIDYSNLGNTPEYKIQYDGTNYTTIPNSEGEKAAPGSYLKYGTNGAGQIGYYKVNDYTQADQDQAKIDQKKFNWLEYYKIKFKADWYTKLYGDDQHALVLRSLAEFGYLGAYNPERGVVPFERFYVGGDGLANYSLDGREVIQLRGYPNQSLSTVNGSSIYNKFSLELRYPITLKAAAKIYALTFAEGGSAYNGFNEYNPFVLHRSAGAGVRIFMSAFGLLGIDMGYGFDPVPGSTKISGWQTHFIIGQQF